VTATITANLGDDITPLKWRSYDGDEEGALGKHLRMLRADDRSKSTISSHERRLRLFIDWLVCHPIFDEPQEVPGIEKTTELTR